MNDLMLTAVLSMPYDMAMGDEFSRRQFWDRAQQALAEIERLQVGIELIETENADLRTKLDAANDLAEMIASERDELRRKLAESEQRFDWLTERLEDVQIDDVDPNDHYYDGEEDVPFPILWRRAIDAAMGARNE